MNYCIKEHPVYGRTLFCDNSVIEIGVPLEFGLRIGHFSFLGGENVFFVQPDDLDVFTTPEGWQIRGGHRLWLAPEGMEDYYPDNEPISYMFEGETLVLTQREDPWLCGEKSFRITMDGAKLTVTHRFTNRSTEPRTCSLWAISAMAPGGVETIPFARREDGMDPWHRISMWDYTDLGNPCARYTLDGIVLTQGVSQQRYKIGVGHPDGPVTYENGSVIFKKTFPICRGKTYPDGNVCYETFVSPYMVEIESLSPLTTIPSGGVAEHTEILELIHK